MANKKQLAMLKRSVKEWNAWRIKNYKIMVDLQGADLHGAKLARANLHSTRLHITNLTQADLRWADLRGADLRGANLFSAMLAKADLKEANIWGAYLGEVSLYGTDLSDADVSHSDLTLANLFGATLYKADLNGALLYSAVFDHTKLRGANFTGAHLDGTIFVNVNLSAVKGLERLIHEGPSNIGIDTLYKSKGKIPETFLRGCGLPDAFITFSKSLVGKATEYPSCFISYSSKDENFAKRFYADLQSKGVRCFFAPEDLKAGDKFRTRIDEAIRLHDKLLLVLSENSINSEWVEKEVETAFERERRDKRTVLFPVRLDETVMYTDQAWAADIRRTRHIGDFTSWKRRDGYKQAFHRLMRDLHQ